MGTPLAIAYHKDALDGLRAVEPKKIRRQIVNRIDALALNPKPAGCVKVLGMSDRSADVYRIRQGDYRVLYSIHADAEIVVLDIGHRKDVYR